jgi:hypothetical protein
MTNDEIRMTNQCPNDEPPFHQASGIATPQRRLLNKNLQRTFEPMPPKNQKLYRRDASFKKTSQENKKRDDINEDRDSSSRSIRLFGVPRTSASDSLFEIFPA